MSNSFADGLTLLERMEDTSDSTEEFIKLLAQNERQLHAYVFSLITNTADAEDVLQNAKVIMWRHFEQFNLGTNFGAWSRKIAFHQILSYRKKQKKQKLHVSDECLQLVAEETEKMQQELESQYHLLQSCITKLPEKYRSLIELRYRDGLSIENMAPRSGQSEGAVYRMLSRVRTTLQDCVAKHYKQQENHS